MRLPTREGSLSSILRKDIARINESSILPYTSGLVGVNLTLNDITSNILYGSLVLIALLILTYRVSQIITTRLRLLLTLNLSREQQRYWEQDGSLRCKIKMFLTTAPLVVKRHNRELTGWKSLNFGTIPSRLHTIFLIFYLSSNLVYCCVLDYWHQSHAALMAEVRGRTGHLAVMNMLPLFLFAARNNPLINPLNISFDAFNLFHRWIGRIIVIEAVAHSFLWGVNNYDALGLEGLTQRLAHDSFLIFGFISAVSLVIILIQSVSFARHAFYEVFLHIHQLLVLTVLVCVLLHCESQNIPQKPLVYVFIGIWASERLFRVVRIFSNLGTRLDVEALPGNACRLSLRVPRTWEQKPGQYVYIYIPSVSLWMSHPFSVAWVSSPDDRTLTSVSGIDSHDTESKCHNSSKYNTKVTLIVPTRSGMTRNLFKRAQNSPTGALTVRAFLEGPYSSPGGSQNLNSYGTVVLFAGGVGITCHLTHLRDLILESQAGRATTKRLVLVWAARSLEVVRWAREFLDEIREMVKNGRQGWVCDLEILISVSQNPASVPISSPRRRMDVESTAEKGDVVETCGSIEGIEEDFAGAFRVKEHLEFRRINVEDLVRDQFQRRIGAMSVGFCGPGGFGDDVRDACRKMMRVGMLDFWEEAFTW